jgi:carbonic anhydrase/acetyltransferase-like protein (isoleucine patch superfamily)
MILPHSGIEPDIPSSVFVAPTATVIGDVGLEDEVSVWFNTVLRGDVSSIRVGARTNIQDGSILHGQLGEYDVRLGSGVTIGHGAIVHGCVIEDDCLIGMGARILNGATIGPESIVAAGAVVTERTTVAQRTLVAGVPAKVIRDLGEEEIEMIRSTGRRYLEYMRVYLDSLGSAST